MKFNKKYYSANFNERNKFSKINLIIIHYTAISETLDSIKYLRDKKNKVSCHYLISREGEIFQLVNLEKRAWHAGKSFWRGTRDINSSSIGIELVNSGLVNDYEDFDKKQILSLKKLLSYLKKLYKINDIGILGHSDIAPYRKLDPGKKFPWHLFSDYEIPKNLTKKNKFIRDLKEIQVLDFLLLLHYIGYDIRDALYNKNARIKLIKAFQSRFQQKCVNGKANIETLEIANNYHRMLTEIKN